MGERDWWCPNCKQVVRLRDDKGCGFLLVVTVWLGFLAIAVWLAAWWLTQAVGISVIPAAVVGLVVAGVVVKLSQDKMMPPSSRCCPICKTDNLQQVHVIR